MPVGGVHIPITADAKQFKAQMQEVLKHIQKFRSLGKGIEELKNSYKKVGAAGVKPLGDALKKLNEIAKKNKLIFKSIKPDLDVLNNAYKKLSTSAKQAGASMSRAGRQAKLAQTDIMGATTPKGGGFGSAEWFKQRAIWFAQLRATWAAYQGAQQAIRDVLTLNQAMTNLAAITGRTAEDMEMMETAIRDAAVATKFFAADMANAAVKLAQAGFNAREVAAMMEPIAVLASATNRELVETADALRIVIRGFGLSANDAAKVANVLAAGVRTSAIQIEDMNQGFQHFITTARQFGWSVEDLVAWMGVLRDVGFKAGTSMTALRQITKVLTDETPEFARLLRSVGLTFKDVDSANVSFEEAMRRMNAAGLTAADIFSTVRVRAAGVLTATRALVEAWNEKRDALIGTNTAYEMNEIQMRAVQNQLKKIKSIIQEVIASVTSLAKELAPLVEALKVLVQIIGAGYVTGAFLLRTIDKFVELVTSLAVVFLEALTRSIYLAIRGGLELGLDYIRNNFVQNVKLVWRTAMKDFLKDADNTNKSLNRIFSESPVGGAVPGETGGGPPPGRTKLIGKEIRGGIISRRAKFDPEKQLERFYNLQRKFVREEAAGAKAAIDAIRARMVVINEQEARALDIEARKAHKESLEEQIALVKEEIAAVEIYTDQVGDQETELKKLESQLLRTNAEIGKQEYLLRRTPWEGFRDGVREATKGINSLADRFAEAGEQIWGIVNNSLVTALDGLGDTLADQSFSWRDWADDAVRAIRSVINQLLVFSLLKTTLGGTGLGAFLGITAAEGGVIPRVKSISRFGRGGTTSGPAMAILGDNPSGKELVVPAEAIQRDSASGFVREQGQGDMAIINFVDPNLMFSALSSMQGKNVVVNHISEDIVRRGTTYNVLRGVR